MPDKEVLTQDEIDALLSGVEEGEVETEGREDQQSVSEYDLANQDRVVRGRLPAFEMVTERFIRRIRTSLPAYLKVPIEIGSGGVQVLKYGEFMDTLYVPTCIKLLRVEPFVGTSILAFEAKLVHRLVDRFFGGVGEISSFESSEFTRTEDKVVGRITELLLADFEHAWGDILNVQCTPVGDEINPGLLNMLAPNDAVMVTSFRVDMTDGSGEFHFAFPYAALEPHKQLFNSSGKQDDGAGDDAWQAALKRSLMDVELPLSCLIGEAEGRVR